MCVSERCTNFNDAWPKQNDKEIVTAMAKRESFLNIRLIDRSENLSLIMLT
jgi:hypothetical protein